MRTIARECCRDKGFSCVIAKLCKVSSSRSNGERGLVEDGLRVPEDGDAIIPIAT